VDDHGALALAWVERDDQAPTALVLRRAWVDWNGTGDLAPSFDAPIVLGRNVDAARTVGLAGVPGGVLVTWVGSDPERSLWTRRVGLDLTCVRP
jgi:hypothetical protein